MTMRRAHNIPARCYAPDPAFDPSAVRGALGRKFLAMLAEDFARAGRRTIVKLRRRRPQDYLRLSAALLPKEFRIKDVDLSEIPDAELDAMLTMLRKLIAEQEKGQNRGASPSGDRAGEPRP